MGVTEEPGFKISAAGYLTVLGIKVQEGKLRPQDLWDEFLVYVSREAKQNCGEGLPCLVMVDGGHCITAAKKPGVNYGMDDKS